MTLRIETTDFPRIKGPGIDVRAPIAAGVPAFVKGET